MAALLTVINQKETRFKQKDPALTWPIQSIPAVPIPVSTLEFEFLYSALLESLHFEGI